MSKLEGVTRIRVKISVGEILFCAKQVEALH